MKVEELENFNPIRENLPGAWLIIKASDTGATPNWFSRNDKIKKHSFFGIKETNF